MTSLVSFEVFEMGYKPQETEKDKITVREWNGDAVALDDLRMIYVGPD